MKEDIVKATCISCGKTYWATEAYMSAVQNGAAESLCGYCDPNFIMEEAGHETEED